MIKRALFNITIVFVLALVNDTNLYAQRDTTQTHSLDEYTATDSATTTIDTVIAGSETEDSSQMYSTVDSVASFSERFSRKQNDTLSSVRSFPPDEVKKMKSDDDFWYADTIFKKEKEKTAESDNNSFWEAVFSFFSNRIVKIILWILMIAVLAGAFIMFLTNNKIALFGSSGKKIKQAEEKTIIPDNIFEIDFDLHVSNALKDGDYSMATRLLFLRMLKIMSQKNLLNYSSDKTNMDYLFELNGTKHFKDFATASRNYEYVWYGNFNITQEQFGNMKDSFDKFNHY